jgi:protease I
MKKLMKLVLVISIICFASVSFAADSAYLKAVAAAKGVPITSDGSGGYLQTEKIGPNFIRSKGPLVGKKIAVLAGCSFSDWQAYYLASYISEFGGTGQFVMDNNHLWKSARPMNGIQTEPLGAWGLSLTGGFNGQGINGVRMLPPCVLVKGQGLAKDYPMVKAEDYDALIIMGEYAGDIMYSDDAAIAFVKTFVDKGAPIVGIGGGVLPMIRARAVAGKNVTGGSSSEYMLKKIAKFKDVGDGDAVTDGNIVTTKGTLGAPAALRALCKIFDPNFVDMDKGVLKGKKVMAILTDDFEDLELATPFLELWYRGATFIVGMYPALYLSKGASQNDDYRSGQFGLPVPFGEISLKHYKIIKGKDLKLSDWDALFTPGAFSPWQMIEQKKPLEMMVKGYEAGKIVAVICHGPLAASASDIVKGKKCAGWICNADPITIMGGEFDFDWAATWDGKNFVSGRVPCDVPQFLDFITAALLAKK